MTAKPSIDHSADGVTYPLLQPFTEVIFSEAVYIYTSELPEYVESPSGDFILSSAVITRRWVHTPTGLVMVSE